MKPDIDTTKPIQVAYKGIGQWFDFCLIHLGRKHAYGFTTKDMDKPDACEWDFQEWNFRNKPEEPSEPTDTLKAQPEIDWSGELEVANHKRKDDWNDFTLIAENEDHVYGHLTDAPRSHAGVWEFRHWQFRNKPQGPNRKKAIVRLWRKKTGGGLQATAFVKVHGTTVETVKSWQPPDVDVLSVTEIDLPEDF